MPKVNKAKNVEEKLNVHDQAQAVLDTVMEREDLTVPDIKYTTVEEALESEKVVTQVGPVRERSRVLFITQETSVLNEGSLEHAFYLRLASRFDEIHMIALSAAPKGDDKTKRYGTNFWVYLAAKTHDFLLVPKIKKLVSHQLVFTDGFRPDFIVATDPYESAVVATALAEKYDRPFQIHVTENFWDRSLPKEKRVSSSKRRMAKGIIKVTDSVRTRTDQLAHDFKQKFPKVMDVSPLPRHYNLNEIAHLKEEGQEDDMFPQSAQVALAVGALNHDSKMFRVIDAARDFLKSPKNLLVIVGDGAAKDELRKRAEILGLEKQILFKPAVNNLLPYFGSVDMLIVTDVTDVSNDIVLRAAAAGTAMLLAKNELRADLFTDGEDTFLCESDDTQAFALGIDRLSQDEALRTRFRDGAQQVVTTRVDEDIEHFYTAYQNTLERVFNLAPQAVTDTVDATKS